MLPGTTVLTDVYILVYLRVSPALPQLLQTKTSALRTRLHRFPRDAELGLHAACGSRPGLEGGLQVSTPCVFRESVSAPFKQRQDGTMYTRSEHRPGQLARGLWISNLSQSQFLPWWRRRREGVRTLVAWMRRCAEPGALEVSRKRGLLGLSPRLAVRSERPQGRKWQGPLCGRAFPENTGSNKRWIDTLPGLCIRARCVRSVYAP